MVWNDLSAQVAGEFCDAQEPLARRLRMAGWKAHTEFVKRTREAKRRYTLRQIRFRLFRRRPIRCKNQKCAAEFVPWHAKTTYCTTRCRIASLSLAAYHRRRASLRSPDASSCKQCGDPVRRKKTDAIYCSVKCNRVAVRKRARLLHV